MSNSFELPHRSVTLKNQGDWQQLLDEGGPQQGDTLHVQGFLKMKLEGSENVVVEGNSTPELTLTGRAHVAVENGASPIIYVNGAPTIETSGRDGAPMIFVSDTHIPLGNRPPQIEAKEGAHPLIILANSYSIVSSATGAHPRVVIEPQANADVHWDADSRPTIMDKSFPAHEEALGKLATIEKAGRLMVRTGANADAATDWEIRTRAQTQVA